MRRIILRAGGLGGHAMPTKRPPVAGGTTGGIKKRKEMSMTRDSPELIASLAYNFDTI
jgi:hypothetical protein